MQINILKQANYMRQFTPNKRRRKKANKVGYADNQQNQKEKKITSTKRPL